MIVLAPCPGSTAKKELTQLQKELGSLLRGPLGLETSQSISYSVKTAGLIHEIFDPGTRVYGLVVLTANVNAEERSISDIKAYYMIFRKMLGGGFGHITHHELSLREYRQITGRPLTAL